MGFWMDEMFFKLANGSTRYSVGEELDRAQITKVRENEVIQLPMSCETNHHTELPKPAFGAHSRTGEVTQQRLGGDLQFVMCE
jgi:hypothetical protein